MAGNSSPTDSHSESTCVNATAGAAMQAAPITRRNGASAWPRRASASISQPPQNTPAVLAASTTAPSI